MLHLRVYIVRTIALFSYDRQYSFDSFNQFLCFRAWNISFFSKFKMAYIFFLQANVSGSLTADCLKDARLWFKECLFSCDMKFLKFTIEAYYKNERKTFFIFIFI